jgi:predicted metal-dependent hydrolase
MTNKKSNNIEIKPYRQNFEFSQTPENWMGKSAFLTNMMNSLSILFPEGEQFFVDSVRNVRKQINDKKLQKDISGFIGQEAMHSMEHKNFNEFLKNQKFPVNETEKHLKTLLNTLKRLPKRHQLAITCALEHITAIMAEMILTREDLKEKIDFSMKDLWTWHAIEEIEHKSVAYDVFNKIGGTYQERVFYQILSTATLITFTSYVMTHNYIKNPSKIKLKDILKGIQLTWGMKGAFTSLIPKWLDYFRKDFHPWDHDNSELVKTYSGYVRTH